MTTATQLLHTRAASTEARTAFLSLGYRQKSRARPQESKPQQADAIAAALERAAQDTRTPASSLKLLMEMLTACNYRGALERLSPRTRKVRHTLAALNDALNDMLDAGFERAQNFGHYPALIDLGYVIERGIEVNAPLAETRSVSLMLCGCEAISLWADGRRVCEAVAILCEHLVRQARHGTRILCTLSRAGGRAVIRISDDGLIPAGSECEAPFHPFSRAVTSEDDIATPGAIRLWIACLIAERHAGRVSAVADEAGRLAELILELPLRQG